MQRFPVTNARTLTRAHAHTDINDRYTSIHRYLCQKFGNKYLKLYTGPSKHATITLSIKHTQHNDFLEFLWPSSQSNIPQRLTQTPVLAAGLKVGGEHMRERLME